MNSRDELEDLFEEHILPHAEFPAHQGHLRSPDAVGVARNPSCGDQVRIEVMMGSGGRIEQAVHESQGCVISRAAADLLCENLRGRIIDECMSIAPEEMLKLLSVPLTPARRRCALLAYHAFRAIRQTGR